jgi:hypothetical protein
MDARQAIESTMTLTEVVVSTYLSDFSDADLLVRPAPQANHMAWQLGHLISSEHQLVEAIAPGTMPKLPEGFSNKYTKDTTKNDDPKAFLPKAEYIRLRAQQREGARTVLSRMKPEDLDKPAPEHLKRIAKTVGDVFTLIATHPLMHAGQWVVVRRQLGKPIVI